MKEFLIIFGAVCIVSCLIYKLIPNLFIVPEFYKWPDTDVKVTIFKPFKNYIKCDECGAVHDCCQGVCGKCGSTSLSNVIGQWEVEKIVMGWPIFHTSERKIKFHLRSES